MACTLTHNTVLDVIEYKGRVLEDNVIMLVSLLRAKIQSRSLYAEIIMIRVRLRRFVFESDGLAFGS